MVGSAAAASTAVRDARRHMYAGNDRGFRELGLRPTPPTTLPHIGNFFSLTHPRQSSVGTLAPGKDPTDRYRWEVRDAVRHEAKIAAYPYKHSIETDGVLDDTIQDEIKCWDTERPLALAAGEAAGLSTKGAKGCIFDKKTGLTAYVLRNPKTVPPEVRIVFGDRDGLKKLNAPSDPPCLKKGFMRWIRNLRNARRKNVSESFKQASELTRQVQSLMEKDKKFEGWSLKLSGYGNGGAQAAYAAVTQEKVLPARCFSSEHLSSHIINALDKEKQQAASEAIIHYQPAEDWCFDLRWHEVFLQDKVIGKPVILNEHNYSKTIFRRKKSGLLIFLMTGKWRL